MGTFNKLKRSRKSSHLDEKIKFLNKELKKTGVVCEAAPANSTAGIYNIIDFTEGLPEIISDVPDSTGFIAGTSTQDANGGDESDSSTWSSGWNNVSDMQNSNDLNGESNRNIPFTPNLSGWNGTSASANSAVIFGGERPEGQTQPSNATGIAVYSGDQGQSCIGSVGGGNHFVQILIGDAVFGGYAYPAEPKSPGYYSSYSDDEFTAARNLAAAYEANKNGGSVTRKAWVPFETANNGASYADYTGAKKTTTTYTSGSPDGAPTYWALKTVNFLTGQRQQYISQNSTPNTSTVIFSAGLDDGNFFPGFISNFMNFLSGALDVGQEALDWLIGIAEDYGHDPEHDGLLGDIKDVFDANWSTAGQVGWGWGIADSVLNDRPYVSSEPTGGQIQDYFNHLPDNNNANNIPINDQKQNFADGNIYVDDSGTTQSNIGPNGESGYYETPNANTQKSTDWIGSRGEHSAQVYQNEDGEWMYAYDDHAYHNLNSTDAGEVQGPAAWASDWVHQVADVLFGRDEGETNIHGTTIGVDNTSPNTGGMANYPCNSTACIRGDNTLSWEIPVNEIQNDEIRNILLQRIEAYKKQNEKYEPKGKVIKEGWESPKHTYIDKNQQKRWFKEKDVAPIYPKKAPPKLVRGYHPDMLPKLDTPIPQIKVKAKDLIRSYKLKKVEAQEWIYKIERLNDYIARNPDMLAYARERYPKSDPHLAALNYKMDMQLAAADEYIEKQFPENIRLYNKLMSATKRSIKLTDPKTFKSEKGVFTTFNKLARVQHVDNVYQPKERKLKLKKRGKNSVNRFLFKPKKKTKDDILKDKLAVLDKEMQKTMPDT